MSVANLIEQINSNVYLKKALVNPLLNSQVSYTEEDAMNFLSLYSEEELQNKVDYMMGEISKAQEIGDTDALFRLEHNLFQRGDVFVHFDGSPYIPTSQD